MRKNWQTSRLGEQVTLQRGFDLPKKHRLEGNIPIISSSGVTGWHSESKIMGPGVVTGRYGTVGKVFYSEDEFWPLNTTLFVKDFKNNHPKFIYYLLQTINYNTINAKSSVPGINRNDLHQIVIKIPPFDEQLEISRYLSDLDNKIELNNQINDTLEEMAITLYKHWFVDFGPFQDGRFVESELGDIPKGWEIVQLNDIVDKINSREKSGSHLDDVPYVPIDMIEKKKMMINDYKEGIEAKSSLINFKYKDILFGAMRPYFHKVSVAPFDGVTRTTCFVLRPKSRNLHSFSLCTMFSDDTVEYANSHSTGSTIPYSQWDGSLSTKKVILPKKEVLAEFQNKTETLFDKMISNYFTNKKLMETRDYLLPRLLSGEINLSNIKESIET